MNPTSSPSILGRLRAVTPRRAVTFDEALRVAELQATKLADSLTTQDGIHAHHIEGLHRFTVAYEDIAVSGMSHWNGEAWVITINKYDSAARQRFTLLHEFKHVVDHNSTERLYTGTWRKTANQQAEMAADYFAGCALVPKRQLKSAWGNGIQQTSALADFFGVSEPAIRVRLAQTGLDASEDRVPTPRCARPVRTEGSSAQRFRPAPAPSFAWRTS